MIKISFNKHLEIMKTKRSKLLYVLVIAALNILPGCNSAAENLEDAQDKVNDANVRLLSGCKKTTL
jgi:hypothetical protein